MSFFRPFRRHSAWAEQLDAYVDEELSGAALERFTAHLARCPVCQAGVTSRQELKQMVRSLPELPVTRSFRITPGMLVETPARTGRGRIPAISRLAQVTAGVAALAFVALLAIDFAGGDGDTDLQPASGDYDAFEGSPAPGGEQPERETTDSLGTPQSPFQGDELPPAADDGVGAQSADATPAIPSTGPDPGSLYEDEAEPSPRAGDTPSGRVNSDAGAAEDDGGEPPEVGTLRSEPGEDGTDAMLVAQVAVGLLAALAAGTWLLTRRRRAA